MMMLMMENLISYNCGPYLESYYICVLIIPAFSSATLGTNRKSNSLVVRSRIFLIIKIGSEIVL